MGSPLRKSIPNRAQTLEVLRLMGAYRPLLMLPGDDDGYGSRWLLDGQQVLPGIAKFLIDAGYLVDAGVTEFGARQLALSDSGKRFRDDGVRWWSGLSRLQRLWVIVVG